MTATVAERGQVTIPRALRERLGITPKTTLDFHEDNGRLVAVKVSREDAVSRVFGRLKPGRPVDKIMSELRGKA